MCLLEKVSNGCLVEINEIGIKIWYKFGVLIGGCDLVYDCGIGRLIGYFLELLFVLGLFGKKSLMIILKGIINGGKDFCMDMFCIIMLFILKYFGVLMESLELKIVCRGVLFFGGGEVCLKVFMVFIFFIVVIWMDEGMVKCVRGVVYFFRVLF